MYSLTERTQLFQLTDEDWTHHAVICLFWAKRRLDKNAASGCCLGWCYFDADESWHFVHLFSKSKANISQASSPWSRLLSLHQVWSWSRLCNLLLYTSPIEPLAVIFFIVLSHTPPHFHPTSQGHKANPPHHQFCKEPGAWGASQHCFEVERLKGKDLSNWDDGAKVGRGGGSVRGTGKAVNTESLGSPRDIIKSKAFLWGLKKQSKDTSSTAFQAKVRVHYYIRRRVRGWLFKSRWFVYWHTHLRALRADEQPHDNHFHPS